MAVVGMTQDEYITLLGLQRNPDHRMRMKNFAYGAMYGSDPDAHVFIPQEFLPPGWSYIAKGGTEK